MISDSRDISCWASGGGGVGIFGLGGGEGLYRGYFRDLVIVVMEYVTLLSQFLV